MELLVLLAVTVAGLVTYRSRLVAAALPAPTPEVVPGGSALPFELESFEPVTIVTAAFETALESIAVARETEQIRGSWEDNVQQVLDGGGCDELIRTGADRAAVMVKIISILGPPPGKWKGTPGMTWGARVSIEDRIAFVLAQLPEDVPFVPPEDAPVVVAPGVTVIVTDVEAQRLEALAEAEWPAFDFPDFEWGW